MSEFLDTLFRHLTALVRYFAAGFITIGSATVLSDTLDLSNYLGKDLNNNFIMSLGPLLVGIMLYAFVFGLFQPICFTFMRDFACRRLQLPKEEHAHYSDYLLLKMRAIHRKAHRKDEPIWISDLQRNNDLKWSCMYLLFCSGMGAIVGCAAMWAGQMISPGRGPMIIFLLGFGVTCIIGGFFTCWHVLQIEIMFVRDMESQGDQNIQQQHDAKITRRCTRAGE